MGAGRCIRVLFSTHSFHGRVPRAPTPRARTFRHGDTFGVRSEPRDRRRRPTAGLAALFLPTAQAARRSTFNPGRAIEPVGSRAALAARDPEERLDGGGTPGACSHDAAVPHLGRTESSQLLPQRPPPVWAPRGGGNRLGRCERPNGFRKPIGPAGVGSGINTVGTLRPAAAIWADRPARRYLMKRLLLRIEDRHAGALDPTLPGAALRVATRCAEVAA
jgi:hypothetical protein